MSRNQEQTKKFAKEKGMSYIEQKVETTDKLTNHNSPIKDPSIDNLNIEIYRLFAVKN